jgi:hypothetical protein
MVPTNQHEIIKNEDGTETEYFYFDAAPSKVEKLLCDLYENHWQEINTTYCIQGAVFELFPLQPKKLSMLDGYFTVDTGLWHIHLCIGDNRSSRSEEVAQHRKVSKAAFLHTKNGTCTPENWAVRLWNGAGEQMITIFLPNPHLDDNMKRQKEPRWGKLELWNRLIKEYTSIG